MAQTHERGRQGGAGLWHRHMNAGRKVSPDMAGKKKKTSWFIKKKLPVREVNAPGLKGVSARALARADRLGNRVYKVQRAAKAVDVILKIAGRIL